MVVIQPTQGFLRSGAVVLTDEELDIVIHALLTEYDRVAGVKGATNYGTMTLTEFRYFISELQRYRKEKGA